MSRNCRLALAGLLLVAGIVAIAAGQSSSPNPSPPPPSSPAKEQSSRAAASASQAHQSNNILQVRTRVVTVDVIATDSHGAVVRGLNSKDFEVSDSGRQKIDQFAFIDRSRNSATAKPAGTERPSAEGFYTNQGVIQGLTTPPTVVLVDAFNTNADDLLQTRRHLLQLLKTLPPDAPVAVLLLKQSLVMVQGFTSDTSLLGAAVDRTMSPSATLGPMPEDDVNNDSFATLESNAGGTTMQSSGLNGSQNSTQNSTPSSGPHSAQNSTPSSSQNTTQNQQAPNLLADLEDFLKNQYASRLDIQVDTTVAALTTIARYLSGYPGRKNLIWVSESFPIVLWPDLDYGSSTGAFESSRAYRDQVQKTINVLADSQVAVYPVDARGLDSGEVLSVANPVRNANPRFLAQQLTREETTRGMSQLTMDVLAQDTGGKMCKDTNDLSGCVEAALKDSSSYYELAYYPQNIKWDGSFHTISVKTTRPGVNLAYRRGYFAQDTETVTKKQPADKRLEQACEDYLPSTAIPITAQAAVSEKPDEIRFMVSVARSGLSLAPEGQSYKSSALMGTCVYGANGSSFQFTMRDLSQTFSAAGYQDLQANGLRGYLNFPKADASRVRIAVLDLRSGLTGALDIPVPQEELEKAGELSASAATLATAAARTAASEKSKPLGATTSINFRTPSGQSSALDWGGDKLIYRGDLGVDRSAAAFFASFVSTGAHCESGNLVANDPHARHKPNLQLTFTNHSGQTSVVDLKGRQPEYSGTLPVDPGAKPFFEQLRYLFHCQTAP